MEKVCEKILYEGRWLAIKEQHYLNKDKQPVYWESISRKKTRKILVILAKMKPSNRYVLIKQFRPSINNTVIGFPAGLANSEDIQKEALKELKEETGYFGKVTAISPKLAFNPALTDEIVYVITVEIDEHDPENKYPIQSLEPAEEIEVVLVDESKVKDFLLKEHEKGVDIGIALWYLFGFNS